MLAYYFGIGALFPCLGLVLGPLALVLGVFGLTCSRRQADARGAARACKGIALGTVATLLNVGGLAFWVLGDVFLW